jgi:hypothetical protein
MVWPITLCPVRIIGNSMAAAATFGIVGLCATAAPVVAQSGAIVGATLDSQASGDSLLPSGSFRLDAPSVDPLAPSHDDPHDGATSLGLQIYGTGISLEPAPASTSPVPAPDDLPPQP